MRASAAHASDDTDQRQTAGDDQLSATSYTAGTSPRLRLVACALLA